MRDDDCQRKDGQSPRGQLVRITHQQVGHENDYRHKDQEASRRADEIARERNPERTKVQTAGKKIARERVAKVVPRIDDERGQPSEADNDVSNEQRSIKEKYVRTYCHDSEAVRRTREIAPGEQSS